MTRSVVLGIALLVKTLVALLPTRLNILCFLKSMGNISWCSRVKIKSNRCGWIGNNHVSKTGNHRQGKQRQHFNLKNEERGCWGTNTFKSNGSFQRFQSPWENNIIIIKFIFKYQAPTKCSVCALLIYTTIITTPVVSAHPPLHNHKPQATGLDIHERSHTGYLVYLYMYDVSRCIFQ
jgi:hypothetical protein